MEKKDINPWWFNGKVQDFYSSLEKRELFFDIKEYIKSKQIISLIGLRRVGKTVLFHHLIEFLLKDNPKENILYFSFDLMSEDIEKVLKDYAETVDINLKKDKIFVFLDEIQKHKNWENELKILYDNYPNIKFFVSGSATLFIEKKTKESLAGRILSFKLFPLNFREYLKFREVNFDRKKLSLYSEVLKRNFEDYLLTGGFPEVVKKGDKINNEEKTEIVKYIFELVMERVIYIDIPSVFTIDEPELLKNLFKVFSSNPGMIIDYESLADDLKKNRKTISNYLLYLEKAFLIKKIYNYGGNFLTSEKKMKRFYPFSSSFCYLFDNVEMGKIVETCFLMNSRADFFKRDGKKEVDFIIEKESNLIPVEIKYKNSLKKRDANNLVDFCKKKNIKKALLLTKEIEKIEKIDNVKINFVPVWKWILLN